MLQIYQRFRIFFSVHILLTNNVHAHTQAHAHRMLDPQTRVHSFSSNIRIESCAPIELIRKGKLSRNSKIVRAIAYANKTQTVSIHSVLANHLTLIRWTKLILYWNSAFLAQTVEACFARHRNDRLRIIYFYQSSLEPHRKNIAWKVNILFFTSYFYFASCLLLLFYVRKHVQKKRKTKKK